MVVALSTFNAVEKSNFPIFQSLGAMASELHISKLLSDSSPSRLSSGRNRSPFAYGKLEVVFITCHSAIVINCLSNNWLKEISLKNR